MDGWSWMAALGVGAGVVLGAVASGVALHVTRFVRYHRHKGLDVPALTLRAAGREASGLIKLGWWSLRAAFSDGLRVPRRRSGPIVVAIHGYSQNASNMWGLRRGLEADGHPTVGISMIHRFADLERYVDRVEAKLDELDGVLGDGFDVVAHSMGGIVLRMLLVRRPDLRSKIRRVVTLGAPHHGTASVRGLGWWLPELRALHRRSALLDALPTLPDLLPNARLVTVAGTTDTVVYPTSSSLEPGTDQVLLPEVGHAGLLTTDGSIAAVRRALA